MSNVFLADARPEERSALRLLMMDLKLRTGASIAVVPGTGVNWNS